MLDNMDGLSAGVAAIASGGMAILLLTMPDPITQQPQLFVAGLALVILGSLLGFLAHNFPPARIFLGDAGSYAIGFLLSACTLLATLCHLRQSSRTCSAYTAVSVGCTAVRYAQRDFDSVVPR